MMIIIVLLSYHLVWFGSFFYIYWIEAREKNERIFSVTVPEERKSSEPVQQIIGEYRKKMKWFGVAGCLASVWCFFPEPYVWIGMIVVSILTMIVPRQIARAAQKKMQEQKKAEQWSKIEAKQNYQFDLQMDWKRINRKIPWYLFLISVIVHLGVVGWEISYYGHIQMIGMMAIFLIAVTMILIFCVYYIPNHTYCSDHEKNEDLNIHRKMLWAQNCFDMVAPECIIIVWLEGIDWMPIWGFWIGIAIHMVIVGAACFRIIKRTNEFLQIEAAQRKSEETFEYDEDEFWYYGIFGASYNNPYDPELLKTNGNQMGQTINLARPIVKKAVVLFLLAFTLFLGVILVYPVYLDQRHELVEIALTEENIQIKGAFYKKNILINSIHTVELLDELMPMVRVAGTATTAYLSGNFELENGERCKLYIARKHPPYIAVKTTDNKKIFFNDDEEQKTKDCYEQLLLKLQTRIQNEVVQ